MPYSHIHEMVDNCLSDAWSMPVSYHRNTIYNDGTVLMRKLEASPHMTVPHILSHTLLKSQQTSSSVAAAIELPGVFWTCIRNQADEIHTALHRYLTSRYLIDALGPHRAGPRPTLTITFHDN
jgi:hypothetical protein